ncbi:hypothetical protein FTO70_03890 [Methanosarcina sp. KYL-1]|uniref:hypothetical protein n=1 Tax=Methanosarcina sp. KYL-1 TaxID=2602068 RepID=UPI0021011AB9|nr:hypothetical protein [Methanosarcina sp. KYL-1]MCQ1534845.1 hypothetical protein [Methanosarcina sp. KYL-1]
MSYVGSDGKVHVSLSEAAGGHAAQTTASRDSQGNIVGSSRGSEYARAQDEIRRSGSRGSGGSGSTYNNPYERSPQEVERQQSIVSGLRDLKESGAFEQKSSFSTVVNRDVGWSVRTNPQMTPAAKGESKISGKFRPIGGNVYGLPTRAADKTNPNFWLEEHSPEPVKEIGRAYSQGYAAGKGQEYSLRGLRAPNVAPRSMSTYSFSQKANALASGYDQVQNAILGRLPAGTTRDVLTGVTNVPEWAIGAVGGIPFGVETIARNPTTIKDSIGFGLGLMAGETVTKAKEHPGELAGELVGGWLLGKAGGSVEAKVKPGLSKTGFNNFLEDTRGTAGVNVFKSTDISQPRPAITPKEKLETYIVFGDKIIPESSTRISSVRLADDVKLTPEMEEVLFGKPKPQVEENFHISSIKLADDVKITPEMEEALFGKVPASRQPELSTELLDARLKRDIFSPENTAPTAYTISSIRTGAETSQINVIFPVLTSSRVFSVRELTEVPHIEAETLQRQENEYEDIYIPPLVTVPQLEAKMPKEQEKGGIYTPPVPTVPELETEMPQEAAVPIIGHVPEISEIPSKGNIPEPPREEYYFPWRPTSKMKLPVSIEDSLNVMLPTEKPKRRKTKPGELSNRYGDPFDIKIKIPKL